MYLVLEIYNKAACRCLQIACSTFISLSVETYTSKLSWQLLPYVNDRVEDLVWWCNFSYRSLHDISYHMWITDERISRMVVNLKEKHKWRIWMSPIFLEHFIYFNFCFRRIFKTLAFPLDLINFCISSFQKYIPVT